MTAKISCCMVQGVCQGVWSLLGLICGMVGTIALSLYLIIGR